MNEMTIFYRKSTGEMGDIVQGEQTFDMYGDLKQDYELVFNFVVVELDQYVMDNKFLFIIVNNQIKLKDADILRKYL